MGKQMREQKKDLEQVGGPGEQETNNTNVPAETSQVEGSVTTWGRLVRHLDAWLVENCSHHVFTARVGCQMDWGQISFVGEGFDQGHVWLCWHCCLRVSWDVLEQLSANFFFSVIGSDVKSCHANLRAWGLEGDPRLGKHIKDVSVTTLGGHVDRGETELVLLIR